MDDGNRDHRSGANSGRRGRRRAWQARLFPKLTEPLDRAEARPLAVSPNRRRDNPFARVRPAVERADLDAAPPQFTPLARAWTEAINSAETRRAYRRDAAFLMRRLGLDTDAKLVALSRVEAVRYRDELQALLAAGACSAGLARRRMAAALSLYDHPQRQYLVPINPFAKLRRRGRAARELRLWPK